MAAGLYDITTETLGKGHFAVVKLAKHCLTGESVAIKIIDKSRLNKEGLHQLSIEIRLWSRLSEHEHPNVVKLYQVIDTRTKLYLVMEYCGHDVCDLYDHIQKRNHGNGLKESEARHIFKQICSAISYCHSLRIVHRDLKPENILIITQPQEQQMHLRVKYPLVKLIDFGFSNQWADGEMLRTSCGSLAYSAPEILLGDHYDGPKVDIWGLGCILYILLYGSNPFMQINDSETLCRILDCTFSTPPRPSVSDSAIDLIKSLLKRDPNTRLEVNQILTHAWFDEEVNDDDELFSSNSENTDYIPTKSPFVLTKQTNNKISCVHDRVIDLMILKGLGTTREHIEKALERARVSDTGNRTSPVIGNECPLNGDKVQSNIHHDHYIKATYHLLKDKLVREHFTNNNNMNNTASNISGQFQSKRILPKKPRKYLLQQQRTKAAKSSIQELDNGENESLNKTDSNQSDLTTEDDNPDNLGFTLPLNRKCSIVSEEGSCAADGTGSDASGYEGTLRIFPEETYGTHPLVNIIVTDCSEKDEFDEVQIDYEQDDYQKSTNIDCYMTNDKINPPNNTSPPLMINSNPGLHVVSSSPELLRANQDDDSSDDNQFNCNHHYQSNNRPSTMILSREYENKLDKHEHFATTIGTNKSSSTNVTSMRVITQSKSCNNILFNEINGKSKDSNPNSTTIDNNQSLRRPNKTDRTDCCLLS